METKEKGGYSMIQMKGDLWELGRGFAVCITTNGAIRKDRACVMGRGVALEAAQRWPAIPFKLGELILKNGNITQIIDDVETLTPQQSKYRLIALPTKHHWREESDLVLIEKSLIALVQLANRYGLYSVFLPRPGCGNGGRLWENEVEPIMLRYLSNDNRFIVVNNE